MTRLSDRSSYSSAVHQDIDASYVAHHLGDKSGDAS